MTTSDLTSRIAGVRARIADAEQRFGREPGSVRLVAVSKTNPPSRVREAYLGGQRVFGENYVQEMVAKVSELTDLADVEWHVIGHLQSNKAKYVARVATLVHTIDSVDIARELGKRAVQVDRVIDALVEVNVARDPKKSGCLPEEAGKVADGVRAVRGLRLRGLMTIPPYADDSSVSRLAFESLRGLRDRLGGPRELPELSMGMSHDFEVAIAEGATIVRVGTAIFGARPPRESTAA